jgi:hypothetical protein
MIYRRIGIVLTLLLAGSISGCSSKSASSVIAPSPTGAPTLTSINGATRPSGNIGSTVSLEGTHFGAVQDTSKVLFSNGTGGTIVATIASPADWTDNLIVATVPSGTGTGPVRVRTSGGTSDSLTFAVTQNSAFSPSTINWSGTTSLPVGLSGHAAVFATVPGPVTTNVVYVIGGADSTNSPRSQVLYSNVQANGQLGPWSPTASLPGAAAFSAAVAVTPFNSRVSGSGYLFVLGGATDASGTPTSAIYRGTLNSSGSVTSWSSAGNLPIPVHSSGVALFNGDIYIAGGATSGNAPVASVYRSRIDANGDLSVWQTLSALPSPRSYHGFLAFGGYLYSFGGESAPVPPNDSTDTGAALSEVAYAKIDLHTGALAAPLWIMNSASLKKAVSKHTSVQGGGNVLITAGIYNGATTGSTEESYAQLNSDGTVGSFNGATGSHTIVSAGGKNLFNHAALSYVDGLGVAHVMVIGGDDLNAPGKKRAEVWYY